MSSAVFSSVWMRHRRWLLAAVVLVLLLAGAWIVADEVQTSSRQAAWLSRLGSELRYELQPGPSPVVRHPQAGPFDQRMGYQRLPELLQRLGGQGFVIESQARPSPRLVETIDQGLFAIYREKTQAGLELLDCRDQPIAAARYPQRVYPRFEAVPRLLVDALLYIEDRGLLDARSPTHNPAVEWDRFAKALADQALRRIDSSHAAAGGSTLATQIEKYRHSPAGRTASASEKLRQMASASLRAYLDGENTLPRRQQIVADYLSTVPLAAQAGFGEVNGIGDGLWAWYGRDFAEVNRLLALPTQGASGAQLAGEHALAFKQALSLLVAQRRPSFYLAQGEPELRELTDRYLQLLAAGGVITPALRDAALPLALQQRAPLDVAAAGSFIDRKAANAVRGRLQALLDMPRSYDLDRLDLRVQSPLDSDAQRAVTALLRSLGDRQAARAAGLYGFRLLDDSDDSSRIRFSFTLYERGPHANQLRVQTDNVDQPFDLNEGARLDLGSTAKLRTLITYLELLAELHQRWSGLSPQQLGALEISPRDVLSRWVRDQLARGGDTGLRALLEAALQRRYSASPGEAFHTGGGLHRFENFEPEDNHRTLSVHEALTRSVNLVFIRLMRDVVRHVMARDEAQSASLIDDPANPGRQRYLARFADQEGREFLARFHRQHAGLSAQASEDLLLRRARPTPVRLAATLYGLEPDASVARLGEFIARRLPAAGLSAAALQGLHDKHGPGRWSLADRAYLAGVHPLELWLVAYLRAHPGARLGAVVAASAEQRQDVYRWLFNTRHKAAQDRRIQDLLEVDAFARIQQAWARLGYPFETLTPSYASALGASGDRPAALAELMGVIVNRGMRLPLARVNTLQFARDTPYETRLLYRPTAGEQVLQPEIADLVRQLLIGVVETGTAKRLKGALVRRDGTGVPIGGKTGTGDHRFDTHGRDGQVLSSRVVNRSATLVFLIGDRFFGTLMAYVQEPHAADYSFTSALPAQLLKALAPVLLPLVDGGGCGAAAEPTGPAAPAITVIQPRVG